MVESKRIDLTQFEEMPKQMEIIWHEHPTHGARYLIQVSEPETPWVVGAIVPDFVPYDNYAKDKAEQEKMAKLFAMTPTLIAELQRMYAREDSLLEALRIIRDDLRHAHYTGLKNGAFTLAQSENLRKIINFANDASQ